MVREGCPLQGVYRNNEGDLFVVRLNRDRFMVYRIYGKKEYDFGSASVGSNPKDPGHMKIRWEKMQGDSFALKLASRTSRRGLAQGNEKHSFKVSERQKEVLGRIFKRLNYELAGDTMTKPGKSQIREPDKFHTIEAIDPKTGRVREYVFSVEEKKK